MDKIFLISLKKDEARREALKRHFENYDEFELIDAVDGREFSAVEYYKTALKPLSRHQRLLSPAEIGCALSHVKAYEAFLQSGAEFGLILEDDVIGTKDDVKKAFSKARAMPKEAVLVCGGQEGLAGRFSAFGRRVKVAKNEAKNSAKEGKDDTLFEISSTSYGVIYRTVAYVVTRHSARALLNTHSKALCTADLWDFLLKSGGLKMYFADIFSHPTDLSGSNLESERLSRTAVIKPKFKERLKSIIFILKTRFEALFLGYERVFKRD